MPKPLFRVIASARLRALTEAIDAVSTISPTLAGWLNQVRTIVTNAQYVERHALFGGLGRALADGWEAFDRGRLADAERLGQQAYEIARDRRPAFCRRTTARTQPNYPRSGWNAMCVEQRQRHAGRAAFGLERLYTPDEITVRDNFSAQMPSKETYLKAMGKGLVELLQPQQHRRPAYSVCQLHFAGCVGCPRRSPGRC